MNIIKSKSSVNALTVWACLLLMVSIFVPKQIIACHGQPLQNLTIVPGPTGVTINANSSPATCGCGPYWMQAQVSCSPVFNNSPLPTCALNTMAFWNQPGINQYVSFPFFNSLLNVPNHTQASNWNDNCVLEPYHPLTISFANLCPGKVYYVRVREVICNPPWNGQPGTPIPSYGTWGAVQSFTTPGAPVTPTGLLTMNLSAAPASIFCGGGTQLTANLTGSCSTCRENFPSCETTATVVPTYSWAASNPVFAGAVPTATTLTNTINIPSLTASTTFSVWLVNTITNGTTTSLFAPPACIYTYSYVTAPINSMFSQVMGLCSPSSSCCPITQPGTANVSVFLNIPVANVNSTPNTCMNAPTFTFTDGAFTPGLTYNWNFGDGNVGVGHPFTHTYAAPGVYSVTLTKSGGLACVPAIQTITVEVFPMPASTLTVNSPVCVGGSITFTHSTINTNSYVWTGPNNFNSTQQSPIITNATPAMAGVYNCTIANNSGCSTSTNVTVSVFQSTIQPSSNSPVCQGSVLNLSVSPGGGAYSWTGPNTFNSNLENPTLQNIYGSGAGVYLVNAILPGNCTASSSIAVVVNTTAVTASNNGPICSNGNLQLTANGVGTFAWIGPNGFTSNQQNPSLPSPGPQATGDYTVTITSPQGCTTLTTTYAVVKAPKILTPKATSQICEGGTIYLEALEGDAVTYLWTGPNGFSSQNANTLVQLAPLAAAGEYTLSTLDNLGCAAIGRVTAAVNPIPKLSIDMRNAKNGCAPICDVSYAFSSSHPVNSFAWDLGNGQTSNLNTPANLCYQVAKNYIIRVSAVDSKGCSATGTTVLEVYPNPQVDFSYTGGPTWVNSSYQFTDLTKGATVQSWNWTFGNGNEGSTIQNPYFTYQDSGHYNVILDVVSDKGCKGSITKLVVVEDEIGFYVPNAFTPNGDNNNDLFMPVATNINKYEMLIFARNGQLVYQTSDYRKGWDGTIKGKLADDNIYVYKINYTDKTGRAKSVTGSLTLIR